MGICTCNKAEDKEIGRKIQEIMEANQKKIDYLEMKCNYLQLMLLNTMKHIPYDRNIQYFENFQNQFNIHHNQLDNQLDNKLNNNNNSNFKIENQKIINIFFEVNGNIYSVITTSNVGLKEVYFIFLYKINNPLYSNINKLKFYYTAKNISKNFINNDRLDTVIEIKYSDHHNILVEL